jgi:hypothetical protein
MAADGASRVYEELGHLICLPVVRRVAEPA